MQTKSEIVFDNSVLEKIAGKTAGEVDGVLSLQGNLMDNITDRLTSGDNPQAGVDIDQDSENKTVNINMDVVLEYGKRATDILDKVTNKISNAVTTMTGYQVAEIKYEVKNMLTREEWQKKQANGSKDDKNKSN